MAEVDSFESKRRIDHTLNVVIEQAGEKVADHFLLLRHSSSDCDIDITFRYDYH